mmetsp:Transcript_30644/g.80029  ORF Transcript_30644/g.80029 Transcript_30644/m.80029 type:complete len:230 (-) Transcript_30644:1894-2583(-)
MDGSPLISCSLRAFSAALCRLTSSCSRFSFSSSAFFLSASRAIAASFASSSFCFSCFSLSCMDFSTSFLASFILSTLFPCNWYSCSACDTFSSCLSAGAEAPMGFPNERLSHSLFFSGSAPLFEASFDPPSLSSSSLESPPEDDSDEDDDDEVDEDLPSSSKSEAFFCATVFPPVGCLEAGGALALLGAGTFFFHELMNFCTSIHVSARRSCTSNSPFTISSPQDSNRS